MALSFDGFAAFASMARHPETFRDVRAEADKQARIMVKKQIVKIKRADITRLREVALALGSECFELFVDGMTDAELKAAVGKFDPNDAELKSADARTRRLRLCDLSLGRTEPKAKAPKVKALPKPRAPRVKKSEPERIKFESSSARKQRSPSDR